MAPLQFAMGPVRAHWERYSSRSDSVTLAASRWTPPSPTLLSPIMQMGPTDKIHGCRPFHFFTSSLHHPTPHVSRKGQRIVSFTFCRANNINGWQFKHKCLLKYIIVCMTTAAVQREFSKMLKSLTRKRHYYRWKCPIIALHLNVLFESVSVYCSQIK